MSTIPVQQGPALSPGEAVPSVDRVDEAGLRSGGEVRATVRPGAAPPSGRGAAAPSVAAHVGLRRTAGCGARRGARGSGRPVRRPALPFRVTLLLSWKFWALIRPISSTRMPGPLARQPYDSLLSGGPTHARRRATDRSRRRPSSPRVLLIFECQDDGMDI